MGILLLPTFRHGWGFGVGPDFPVYVWWTRVGAGDGISLVGHRPGVVSMLAVVRGTLQLPLVAAVAGSQYALGPAIAFAAIALVRGATRVGRWRWILGGTFAGLFSVHLVGGYISSLVFAAAFLAAGAAIALGSRRGTVAAALLLGGGGLAHPQFFLLGALVLLVGGAWAYARDRDRGRGSEVARVAEALAGGIGIVAAGILSMLAGPAALHVDTSRDAFLRHAGLRDNLTRSYLDRFRQKLPQLAPIPQLALSVPGSTRSTGYVRRFLLAWAAVTIVGVPIGLVTGRFPPERIMTFGFAFPILAGLGVTWLWDRLRPRRWLAIPMAAVALGLLASTWLGAWDRQQTFESPAEIADLDTVARIAATLPPNTRLVYVVNDIDPTASFLATHAENVILATLPPDRAADASVYVGDVGDLLAGRPTVRGDTEYDALSRALFFAIPAGPRAIFVVRGLNKVPEALIDPTLHRWSAGVTSSVPGPIPLAALPDETVPSSPGGIALATFETLALLLVVGLGWSWWTFGEPVTAVAAAPAFGAAFLALVGLIGERFGVPISGSWGPTAISAVAGGCGFVLLALERKSPPDPTAEVDQQPDEKDGHGRGDDPVPDPQVDRERPRIVDGLGRPLRERQEHPRSDEG